MEPKRNIGYWRKQALKGLWYYVKHWLRHKRLLEDVIAIAHHWSDKDYVCDYPNANGRLVHVGYGGGLDILNDGVWLELTLGPDDTISKDVQIFINEYIEPLAEKHGLLSTHEWESVPFRRITYEFSGNQTCLEIKAYYARSTKCELVGTGEFEEKMKVVCK